MEKKKQDRQKQWQLNFFHILFIPMIMQIGHPDEDMVAPKDH
jgi:hypothetical protein